MKKIRGEFQESSSRPFDAMEVLGRIMDKARAPLDLLPDLETRRQLVDWYLDNFLTLPIDEQTSLLEEFVQHNLVDDEQSFDVIMQMTPAQRGEIGKYIGMTVGGKRYIKTFQRCYFDLEYGGGAEDRLKRTRTRPSFRSKIERRFKIEEPENIAMIAPFVKLKEYSWRAQSAIEILEAMISAHDMVVNEISRAPDDPAEAMEWEGLGQGYEGGIDPQIVEAVKKMDTQIVLPYIPELLRKGIVTQEQVEHHLEDTGYFSWSNFITQEESDEEKELMQELINKKIVDGSDHNYYHPELHGLRKNWMRRREIHDTAKVRAVEHMFGRFEELKPLLDDPQDFLREKLNRNTPVFLVADKLGLSNQELVKLARETEDGDSPFFMDDLSDMMALVRLQRERQGEKPDLEAFVIDQFPKFMQYGYESTVGQALMLHAESIFAQFSDQGKEHLITMINRMAPSLWMINPRFAIEHKVISLKELVRRSAENYEFGEFQSVLLFELKQAQARGEEIDLTAEDLRAGMYAFFEARPQLFIDKDNARLIEEMYSADELHDYITRHLALPVNEHFFSQLITSKYAEGFEDEIRYALDKDKLLFGEVILRYGGVEDTLKIFSIKEFVSLVDAHAEQVDFEELLEDRDFLNVLSRSQKQQERLFDAAIRVGKSRDLGSGFEDIHKLLDEDEKLEESRDKVLDQYLQKIKKLEGTISAANKEKDKQKKEEQLIKLRRELKKTKDDYEGFKTRRPLGARGRGELESMAGRFQEVLTQECEAHPGLVFDQNVIKAVSANAERLIQRDIEAYAKQYPEVILEKVSKQIHSALGTDAFLALFKKHVRALVCVGDEVNLLNVPAGPLRGAVSAMSIDVNPRVGVDAQYHCGQDYYQVVVNNLSLNHASFYDIFFDELDGIARSEKKKHGEQLNATEVTKPSRWIELTNRIAALGASELARFNHREIEQLEEPQLDHVLMLLEFVSVFGIDDVNLSISQVGTEQFIDELSLVVAEHLRLLFELPKNAELRVEDLDLESIYALRNFIGTKAKFEKIMSAQMNEVVLKMLSGTYENWRQWGVDEVRDEEKPEHLKRMQESGVLPKGMTLDQYETWCGEDVQDLEEVFEVSTEHVRASVKELISRSVADHHVSESQVRANPLLLMEERNELVEPLKELEEERRYLNGLFAQVRIAKKEGREHEPVEPEQEQRYEQIKQEIQAYRKEHNDELTQNDALSYLRRLQKISADELQGGHVVVGKARVSFRKVFLALNKAFFDNELFLRDIQVMKKTIEDARREVFGDARVSKQKLTINDQIDGKTYLFIGERPVPSCQSFKSDMSYNRGLVGSMRDANVKFIQMYNEEETIIARAGLRLLSDSEGNPQLFVERVYSTNQHPKVEEAMMNFAKQKAKAMGVGVYTKEVYEGVGSVGGSAKLYSHGSNGAYVYTDAGGGLRPDGVYEINAVSVMAV